MMNERSSFWTRHGFKILLIVFGLIFLLVSYFMLEVHLPYSTYQNQNISIRNEIIKDNNYTYDNYFNVYHGKETFYIIRVKDKKTSKYLAFSANKKLIDSYSGSVFSKKQVAVKFKNKYQYHYTKLEIGYENSSFVYCLTYQGQDKLIYGFYRLADGKFLKGYNL